MSVLRKALLALVCLFTAHVSMASLISPFISEIHYDNVGADTGELVAVTGLAGFDLSGWKIVLYNGSNGQPYRTVDLQGYLVGDAGSLVEAYWAMSGMQNGPDAVALVSMAGAVADFVSYEAAVTAIAGDAAGLTARQASVGEDSATPVGHSLQRVDGVDVWSWRIAPATPGAVNDGLQATAAATVPVSASLGLWVAGLVGMSVRRIRPAGSAGRRLAH